MTIDVAAMPSGGAPFAPYHKWDRNFFLVWVLLIWVGIITGFGGDILRHVETRQPAFPLIVHFHAAAFVGWMLVLTTQTLLVRRQQLALGSVISLPGADSIRPMSPACSGRLQSSLWQTGFCLTPAGK